MQQLALIYTTFPNKNEAEMVAEKLLDQKLIACANIFPAGTSIYQWKGQVEKSDELVVILKTPKNLIDQLKHHFLLLHPYDCPCFVEIKTGDAFEGFVKWAEESVSTN